LRKARLTLEQAISRSIGILLKIAIHISCGSSGNELKFRFVELFIGNFWTELKHWKKDEASRRRHVRHVFSPVLLQLRGEKLPRALTQRW
jgi:hypothetical protein